MEERDIVIVLNVLMLILAALFAYYYNGNYNLSGAVAFNFNNANLTLNNRTVIETLSFVPNQAYHTLFRNFASPIASSGNNSVTIQSVNCQVGTPYYRTYAGVCYTYLDGQVSNTCLPNTLNNEYGCTYGNTLGFSYGTRYTVGAVYTLNPANLFLINGGYYIKFVAYSANNHYELKTGTNFFVNGGVADADYPPSQDVVVYIPYNGSTQGYNIVTQSGFSFSNGPTGLAAKLYNFFLFLFPLILFDAIWLYFAQEKKEPPVPSQLSDLPNERKPWEVSAYFTPPFVGTNKNFYATLMMDLYRRKAIDIKRVPGGFFGPKTFVKIGNDTGDIDNVEKEFLTLLGDMGVTVKDKDRDGDYFDIGKVGGAFTSYAQRYQLSLDSQAISSTVTKSGKEFIDIRGEYIYFGLLIAMLVIMAFLHVLPIQLVASSILMGVVTFAICYKTPLLVRYKQDFYEEYKQWTAFKHGLSYLSSVKNAKADAVVMWEKYLVYATALGVADKVLKQLKDLNMVDAERLGTYSGVYIASSSFGGAMASGGGGGGGAGGGGVGGGGGGGR